MDNYFESILNFCFSAICHQNPGWLEQAGGFTLPVCVRCSGIYTGIFTSQFFLIIRHKYNLTKYPEGYFNFILFAFALPMIIEWISVRFGFVSADLMRRFITGILFGSIIGIYFSIYWNRNRDVTGKNEKSLLLPDIFVIPMFSVMLGMILRYIDNLYLMAIILTLSFVTLWLRVNWIFITKLPNIATFRKRVFKFISALLFLNSELLLLGFIRRTL